MRINLVGVAQKCYTHSPWPFNPAILRRRRSIPLADLGELPRSVDKERCVKLIPPMVIDIHAEENAPS